MGTCLTFRNNNIRSVFLMTLLLGFTLFPMKSFGLYDPPVMLGFGTTSLLKPGEPIHLRVWLKSKIVLKNPKVMIKIPPIGGSSESEIVLWTGGEEAPFTKEFFYDTNSLPPGRYIFEGIVEFTAPDEVKIPMKIGKHTIVAVNNLAKEKTYRMSLNSYLDVRPHKIYVSGAPFEDIEKRELIMEIRLKSGKGKDFSERDLWKLPIHELEKINGGPWKDKLDHHGKPDK